MSHTIKRGTTSKRMLLLAVDAQDGRTGKTGLRHDSPGATAAFVREGEAARSFALSEGVMGAYQTGSFVEVDAARMPGVYQLGVPDEVLAEGAESAVLMVRFEGAFVAPAVIALVAYDTQDAQRLGMSALGPEGRVNALRGAFPRLTAQEQTLTEALKGS